MTLVNFSKIILKWYDRHGRQNLPWRENINPYRVWVSEIMLQQTQVITVLSYYQRFIQCFPTVQSLAAANQDKVLSLWTGLGYYSRARNLHAAAKIIVEKYQGKFPQDLENMQSLPGIGRSTAGAILAIAMNEATPILDGNVKRVLTRFHVVEGWPGTKSVEKNLWDIATKYTPKKATADYTQAIMDLGATICTRANPSCSLCPLQKHCQAYAQGNQLNFPYKNPNKKILPVRQIKMLLLRNTQNAVLLQKRPPTGIWGGLWSFPETSADDLAIICQKQHLQIKQTQIGLAFRHTFSHFHLDITPIIIDVEMQKNVIMDSINQVWYKPTLNLSLGFAAPVKNLLAQLYNQDLINT